MKDPLGKLDRIAEGSAEIIEALVKKRVDALQLLVLRASTQPNVATNSIVRERLYSRIRAEYDQLNDAMDGRLEKVVALAAQVAHEAAIEEAGVETVPDGLIKYDHARTEAHVQLVSPPNDDRLAAVFTDQMTESLIQKLRNTHRDNFHEARLNGWTMRETNKHLQEKWADVAANEENFVFKDKKGREWETARYAQMLTRTTTMRVANAEAIDTAKALGRKLLQISSLNDKWTCEHCAAWAGQIVTFEGRDTRFPGVEDAEDAGVFHPNCRHRLLQADVDFDEVEIAEQADDKENINELKQETEIQRGKKAVSLALETRQDVPNAILREDIGSIDLLWGNDKKGLQHIIKRRDKDKADGISKLSVERMVRKLPEVIMRGKAMHERNSNKIQIEHGGIRAVIAKDHTVSGTQNWVFTGYEIIKDYHKKKSGAS